MGDFDPEAEILEALRKLEFMCGTFHGTRRLWFEGEALKSETVEWQADWVIGGFYLQESSPLGLHYWGYDYLAKQYRRWSFVAYGYFGRGFPDPCSWIGNFEGDRLIMTVESESITPVGRTLLGLEMPTRNLPMKFVYTPGPAGSFTVTQHAEKGGRKGGESFPGYYMVYETLYQPQASPIPGRPEN